MQLYETTEVSASCPYCGSNISLLIDSSVSSQVYIEDCEVCCRPISVHVMWQDDAIPQLQLLQENEIY